jgi:hypothetical protein
MTDTPTGQIRGKQCLFILDEFFSLGYIDEISKSAGLMRGYGLQLWPILQDLGQLVKLYGPEGSETFFGNADLHQFFGNTDNYTLEYMSKMSGTVTLDEIGLPPVMPNAPSQLAGLGGGLVSTATSQSKNTGVQVTGAVIGSISGSITAAANAAEQSSYQNKVNKYQDKMNEYQQRASRVDRPRLSVEEMAIKVSKKNDVVADNMFCVLKGSQKEFYKPLPYFRFEEFLKQVSRKIKRGPRPSTWAICSATFFLGFTLFFVGALFLVFIINTVGADNMPSTPAIFGVPIITAPIWGSILLITKWLREENYRRIRFFAWF